jgi:hypothetical protein
MKRVGDLVEPFVPPFESCGNCTKDGWVGYGLVAQARCRCWKVWKAKVDQQLRAITDVAESRRKKK